MSRSLCLDSLVDLMPGIGAASTNTSSSPWNVTQFCATTSLQFMLTNVGEIEDKAPKGQM